MAHPKHLSVRQRFNYCCGYCGISETDSGGELTVDHYQPVSAGGDDSDENLVYACWRCNLNKSDFWPDAQQVASGVRLLHPLQEDFALHLRENERGVLEALTPTGRVHIAVLQLNRPPLIANRLRTQEAQRRKAQDLLLMAALQLQAQRIEELSGYISELQQQAQGAAEDELSDE